MMASGVIEWPRALALLGTLLPLLGLTATLIGALITQGRWRWSVLLLGPALTLGLCGLIAEPVFRQGDASAASVYILFAFSLALYYPLLAVTWIVSTHARRGGR